MTAASQVLSALRASTLAIEAQAFVAAVIEGETPQRITEKFGVACSPWNILYSGGGSLVGTAGLVNRADAAHIIMSGSYRYWTGPMDATGFPTWSGGKLANGNFSTAWGGPQITRTTWQVERTDFNLTVCDSFGQIQFAWLLAQKVFMARAPARVGSLLEVLQEEGSGLALVSTYLCSTWPGGCNSSASKRYAANLAALRVAPPTEVMSSV